MPPDKYDMTFAMKAIGLSEHLNGSDKRVALAILDHFNRRSGRCDPSRETLGKLLNIAPRTVSRSLLKLAKTRLFKVSRHGGHFNCNSYQPNWRLYRDIEQVWKKRRVACSRKYQDQEVAPTPGQTCPQTIDRPVYQTSPSNSILSTSSNVQQTSEPSDSSKGLGNGLGHRTVAPVSPRQQQWRATTSSEQAARSAAEKRWNDALMSRFGRDATVYGQIVEAITPKLQQGATDAEFQRRGSGLTFLMKELAGRIST
jgi:hypothetical protein